MDQKIVQRNISPKRASESSREGHCRIYDERPNP
jgi:hypothetical protein